MIESTTTTALFHKNNSEVKYLKFVNPPLVLGILKQSLFPSHLFLVVPFSKDERKGTA